MGRMALRKTTGPKKAPSSAFFMYAATIRAATQKELADANGGKTPALGEVNRAMGKKWAELDPATKEQFAEACRKEKERCSTEGEAEGQPSMEPSTDAAPVTKAPVDKSRLEELRCRRNEILAQAPASACELFSQDPEQRTKVQGELQAEGQPEQQPTEEAITARLREQWNTLSEESQQGWKDRHDQEAQAHAGRLLAWEQSPESSELHRLEREAAGGAAAPAAAASAPAVAAPAPAAPAPAGKGRSGKGAGRGRGRGRGRGSRGGRGGQGSSRGRGRGGRGGRGSSSGGRGRSRSRAETTEASATAPAPAKEAANGSAPQGPAAAAPAVSPREEPVASTPAKKRAREPAEGEEQTPGRVTAPTEAREESTASLALDEETLRKARRKGLESALMNLASRGDVKARAFKGADLLNALRKNGGLVHAAKRSLLEEGGVVTVV